MTFKRIWHAAEVLAALDAGATVVTASERLARAVSLAHAEARLATGAKVWERPEVCSYAGFLDRLYEEAVAAALCASGSAVPQRLSAAAAEALWEGVIRATTVCSSLLQPAATARAAQQAWELCAAYRIPLERALQADDEDARHWSVWAGRFAARCREHNWLDAARLPDWIATRLQEGGVPVAPVVVFAGFDDMTPQQELLVAALQMRGTQVQVLEPPCVQAPTVVQVSCMDAEAELRAAAQWARALLQRDADAQVAIVVRDLTADRSRLARALDDALCPGAALEPSGPRPYNLSLGLPLTTYPAVHAALSLLELLRARLPFATVSLLLRSPFLKAASAEREQRARLELRLRARASEEITLKTLRDFTAVGAAPQLLVLLQALLELKQAMPARQLPSAWAATFAQALNLGGWPGPRPLDSGEFQTVERFQRMLGGMAELDGALGTLPLGEALTRFKRLASDVIFQPEAADAPVQVLGVLETAGLAFQHLWLAGLSDDVWPESPRPRAFIPARLQREYRVPHASAGLELEFATRLTQRLLASAVQAVVSAPAREADAELRPSPLITHLPQVAATELLQTETLSHRVRLQRGHRHALEEFGDEQGPALVAGTEVQGGTQLIRSQAVCPFQAFAWHRLGAQPLDAPGLGPDAAERGRLLHALLERVWGELKDHAALIAMDVLARRALVEQAASGVLARRARDLPDVYTPRIVALERERLTDLVSDWLVQEALRAPFRVAERESRSAVRLGPLEFSMRADRIDELPDGSRVVIDYKSGRVEPRGWLEPRPEDPQLPLYAVHNRERLAGVAFASLKPGAMRFAGFADRAGIAPGVQEYAASGKRPEGIEDWAQLLDHWQQELSLLAGEYAHGEARVAPKSPDTCRYCHLATLCRIHELKGLAPAETDDAG